MSKEQDDTRIGFGRFINAGLKRPKDKARIERFWIELPIEMGLRPDFPYKHHDQLVVQFIGKDKLVVTKFDAARALSLSAQKG